MEAIFTNFPLTPLLVLLEIFKIRIQIEVKKRIQVRVKKKILSLSLESVRVE